MKMRFKLPSVMRFYVSIPVECVLAKVELHTEHECVMHRKLMYDIPRCVHAVWATVRTMTKRAHLSLCLLVEAS
jgi:hypothetical protein